MSRPRSAPARGASAAAGRAAPGGRPGVFVQTPRSDVYVALLGVALAAMVLGCLLLILILKRYDFKTKATAFHPPAPAAIAALLEKPVNPVSVRL